MSDVADLKAEVLLLRKENKRIKEDQAHWELGNCPSCPNIADLQEALEQNAKLKEERDGFEAFGKLKEAQFNNVLSSVKMLNSENAKLRMFIDLKETCWKYVGLCDECPYNGVDDEHDDCNCTVREKVNSLARELGVEVDVGLSGKCKTFKEDGAIP